MNKAANSISINGIDGTVVTVVAEMAPVERQTFALSVELIEGGTGHASRVKEIRHRVCAALRACGYEGATRGVVVKIPSSVAYATHVDLSVAVAALSMTGFITRDISRTVFFGELGLEGTVRPVCGGVVAAAAVCLHDVCKELYVAQEIGTEAASERRLTVYGVRTLVDVVDAIEGRSPIATVERVPFEPSFGGIVDMASLRVSPMARRAMEICAAGWHTMKLVGPPGCGKTLMARALTGIMPPMREVESFEVTEVASVSGLTGRGRGLMTSRPFRAPHPTASEAALVGGGNPPFPGEVSLAHRGVLFLDEAAEFRRASLDAVASVRNSDERVVRVYRAQRDVKFPADSLLVLSMTACPCGHAGDDRRECRCTPAQRKAYSERVPSEKLGVQVVVEMRSSDLSAKVDADAETSALVRERVTKAYERQVARGIVSGKATRGVVESDPSFTLDAETMRFAVASGETLGIHARSWWGIVAVARTIADLDGAEKIEKKHVAEAILFAPKE